MTGGPIENAATTGDELAALVQMRDQLAAAMDTAPGYAMARISGQLMRVLERISQLRPDDRPTLAEELDRRRALREAGSMPQHTGPHRTVTAIEAEARATDGGER